MNEPLLQALLAPDADDATVSVTRDWLDERCEWAWANVLRLVLEHPESDGARLLAARWFEESGEGERAEFVRVQVELAARFGVPASGPVVTGDTLLDAEEVRLRRRLRRRLWDLVKPSLDRASWFPGIPKGWLFKFASDRSSYGRPTAYVGRGFVERLRLPAADFLAHADDLMSCQPIREVELTTWPDTAALLRCLPEDIANAILDDYAPGPDVPYLELMWTLLKKKWPRIQFTLPQNVHEQVPL